MRHKANSKLYQVEITLFVYYNSRPHNLVVSIDCQTWKYSTMLCSILSRKNKCDFWEKFHGFDWHRTYWICKKEKCRGVKPNFTSSAGILCDSIPKITITLNNIYWKTGKMLRNLLGNDDLRPSNMPMQYSNWLLACNKLL